LPALPECTKDFTTRKEKAEEKREKSKKGKKRKDLK
jgi:hypothetical protein